MPESDPPIVITGGSVTLQFDSQDPVRGLPRSSNGNHHNANKKLKSITIVGDGLNINQTFPTGKDVTITILYGNGND